MLITLFYLKEQNISIILVFELIFGFRCRQIFVQFSIPICILCVIFLACSLVLSFLLIHSCSLSYLFMDMHGIISLPVEIHAYLLILINCFWWKIVHFSEDKSTTTQVIREVYEGDEHDTFENELEKALEAKVKYIIIEPQRLGDETARWIRVGNCLHKTAVVSGLASIVCGAIMPERPVFSAPLCAISIFCTGLYTVSWNVDYCCQYQVSTWNMNAQSASLIHRFRWKIHVFFCFIFVNCFLFYLSGHRLKPIRKN